MQDILSVIIPVYNTEKYIGKCLKSLLNQTVSSYEIIVVDDGSTDASRDICKSYAKDNSQKICLYCMSNSGVSMARNTGLKYAKGKYVSFVDADDWVEPNYVETLLCEMQGTDLLYFGQAHHFSDHTIKSFSLEDFQTSNRVLIDRALHLLKINDTSLEIYGFTWNKCFRRDIIDSNNIQFTPKLSVREDEIFTSYYCRNIRHLRVISKILYHYRVVPNGLTRKINSPDEVLVLANELYNISKDIQSKKLLKYELERAFDYYFIATMGMKWSSALSNFNLLYSRYKEISKIVRFRHSTYKTIFKQTKSIAKVFFAIIWRTRHGKYRGI